FQLDPDAPTPAHTLRDEVDYVPARRSVLFGHHYASIAGLSPMLGPAIAVIWGWLPALLWVVLGAVFIGAVHDFSALVVSMRARGTSIGKVAETFLGSRAQSLFHAIIFFLVALAMGVFVQVVAQLFSVSYNPEAVFPSVALMGLAMVVGFLFYKKGFSLGWLTLAGFLLTLLSVYLGLILPRPDFSVETWSFLLLAYAFAASVLPVWILLQPRDYLNSLLLYMGLAAIFVGFFVLRPAFVAPAVDFHPDGAPPLFPFVFIVIACGAISGFHGLVSSGTTAKQIDKETDAPLIGYGGMIGESLLGLSAVLACTAGFRTPEAWQDHYRSWNMAQGLPESMAAFIDGSALFLSQLGLSVDTGRAFVALVAVSFALTTLDSATRLLRYNIEEIGASVRRPLLGNRYVSSALAVASVGFFAFFRLEGQPAGLVLWQLFGTTNQILGGLTLLVVTVYLIRRGSSYLGVAIPMVFMIATTIVAMTLKMSDFYRSGNVLLLVMGGGILGLALWLVVEALLRLGRLRGRAVSDPPG
ncbi:MAG TPA: carbon starvation protein A, partial [Vicinamibacteria bacterium]|nr:carbon starvation protein A [Vicinamibacteria bacterium]